MNICVERRVDWNEYMCREESWCGMNIGVESRVDMEWIYV